MKRILGTSLLFTVLALQSGMAASEQSIAKISNAAISQVEGEVVALAEAMPEDKYSFAPTGAEFKGVRTFAQQMLHIATVNYSVSAASLGEKNPVVVGKGENGPADITSKEAIVKYLKDSFAYAHKAASAVTKENYTEVVTTSPGHSTTRAALITEPVWHTFDHYGQAVIYARMNGVVPPASRR
jgi:uncharacterized damage-inducible protein DinB